MTEEWGRDVRNDPPCSRRRIRLAGIFPLLALRGSDDPAESRGDSRVRHSLSGEGEVLIKLQGVDVGDFVNCRNFGPQGICKQFDVPIEAA